MWRFDSARSANAAVSPAADLQPAWRIELPPLEPAWEDDVNQDRMPFDRCYEPIVVGRSLIFGSSRDDLVRALDTRTGELRWQFRCEGPVRLPPAASAGRVFVASDDGCLYALDAENGALLFRHRGGLDGRKVLGNRRLVSTWAARGGPVVAGDTVYYAAGIWPFMGVFLYALDCRSGEVIWENSTLGSRYMNQPHGGAEGFGGLAPQGALAYGDGALIVPGGRSVPAVLDAADGSLRYYNLDGSRQVDARTYMDRKLEGGSHVAATKGFFINHRGLGTTLYNMETGDGYLHWKRTVYPVLDGDTIFLSGSVIEALHLDDLRHIATQKQIVDSRTRQERTITNYHWELPPRWTCEVDASSALIKAGDRLYAAGGGRITSVDVGVDGATPSAWSVEVEGTVVRLLAADERLFAVTAEGQIHGFAAPPVPAVPAAPRSLSAAVAAVPGSPDPLLSALLERLSINRGYCVIYGMQSVERAVAVLSATELNVIGITAAAETAAELRRQFDTLGMYGPRLSIQVGTAADMGLPPYLAALSIIEAVEGDAVAGLAAACAATRPYGGTICLPATAGGGPSLAGQFRSVSAASSGHWQLSEIAGAACLERRGALPGSADWTHLYGDIANSAKSDDQLVRAPLGLLWFGMTGHADVLPRHGHGPTEQVVGGRLFIEGINVLSARDVYTGLLLWRRVFDDLGTHGIYYDDSYRDDPLDTTYNQRHIAGANARGTNYVVTDDALYLAVGPECLVLDPLTGETRRTISLPPDEAGAIPADWGFIGVYEDLLIGGTGFVHYSAKYELTPANWSEKADASASAGLAVFDRHSGELLWRVPARLGFLHNAIVAGGGRLYCIDRLPASTQAALERRGEASPQPPRLLALDARSGRLAWEQNEDVFGTWLGYSKDHDLLLQCGRHSRDMTKAEPNDRMLLQRAADGSTVWDRGVPHGGPAMLFSETIVLPAVSSVGSAIDLETGNERLRRDPVTHDEMPWIYHRAYGCNSVIASEHLLTFRSGTAAFYDLETDCGTANLGGFKSGCTSNLVVANGVLNAPDYTRTCTCSYQNQTSLALVHMPEVEFWTATRSGIGSGMVQSLGLNLGAPGDRIDAAGTLWFEYPVVGGPSPELPVRIEPEDAKPVAMHSARAHGELNWIGASALEGVRVLTVTCRPDTMPEGTVVIPVTTGNDDAEEAATGAVTLGSSDLELVQERSEQLVGVRFRNIPFASADQLGSAYIQFTVDETGADPTNLVLQSEIAAKPKVFAAANHDLSSRARSRAAVTWSPPAWSTVGDAAAAQRTPDLAPLLREVMALPGWRPGNDVVVLISGSGKRVAQAYNRAADAAPQLILEPLPAADAEASAADVSHYTVTLLFAEPGAGPGERRFDVALQGKTVLSGLDIAAQAGSRTTLARTFRHIPVGSELRLELTPLAGSALPPLLNGISLRLEP